MVIPKISIVIPVYNTAQYLKECLDSVYSPDFNDFEIICVDDGSSDDSLKVLKQYAEKDKRVQVISQKNGGPSKARNKGIEIATGKYICFLDSDDMLEAGALERMYQAAENVQADILCYDVSRLLYEDQKLMAKEYKNNFYRRKREYIGIKHGQLLFVEMMRNEDFCNSACLFMVDRAWLKEKKITFYPDILYEDSLFSVQCFMQCERIYHVRQENYIYRVRNDSIMTVPFEFKNIYSYLICYKELLKLMFAIQDVSVKQALAKYIERILADLQYADKTVVGKERAKYKYLRMEEQLLAKSLGIESNNYPINDSMYLDGFINRIRQEKRIILYGAGKVGRKVYLFLKESQLAENVECFAVTQRKDDDSDILGLHVYSITEIENSKKDCFVLIAAHSNFQSDMQENLKRLNYDHIAVIDDRLEAIMDKRSIE